MKALVIFLSLWIWNVSTTSSLLASDTLKEYDYNDPSFSGMDDRFREKLAKFAILHEIHSKKQILALFLAMSEQIAKAWLVMTTHSSFEEGFENDTKFGFLKLVRQSFEMEIQNDDFTEAYYVSETTNALKEFGSSQLSNLEIFEVKESKMVLALEILKERNSIHVWNENKYANSVGASSFKKAKAWALQKVLADPEILHNAYCDSLKRLSDCLDFPFDSWQSWSDFRIERFDELPLTVHRHLAPWISVLNILMASKDPRFRNFAALWNCKGSSLTVPKELVAHILAFYCHVKVQAGRDTASRRGQQKRRPCVIQ